MDWFTALTGFAERDYHSTQQRLAVVGDRLHSTANGKSYCIGELELVALDTLRARAQAGPGLPGRLQLGIVRGDVRAMHAEPVNAHALFQVASQFNLLEMVSPQVTPEEGVTRYQYDATQGPACAMAAAAATIYRNYFVDVGGQRGQTSALQLDGLAGLGAALATALQRPVASLWTMRNGYALCEQDGLAAIAGLLSTLTEAERNRLRGQLAIGVHSAVQVTDLPHDQPQYVSQAFCSALPVGYSRVETRFWEPFATLVLEAAYEATLLAAVLNAQRFGSHRVLLTLLGGGVFGNAPHWIEAALRRALMLAGDYQLDVRIVSHGPPSRALQALVAEFS